MNSEGGEKLRGCCLAWKKIAENILQLSAFGSPKAPTKKILKWNQVVRKIVVRIGTFEKLMKRIKTCNVLKASYFCWFRVEVKMKMFHKKVMIMFVLSSDVVVFGAICF